METFKYNYLIFAEIFLAIVCLVNFIIISLGYFELKESWILKYKFVSDNLLKINFAFLVNAVIIFSIHLFSGNIDIVHPMLAVDLYATFFKILILVTTLFVFTNAKDYILCHLNPVVEFSSMITFASFFLILLVSAKNLIFMAVCIFGFSLVLYVLLAYDSPYKKSSEAATKYFYLSAVSSALIVAGILLVFINTGTMTFSGITEFLAKWTSERNSIRTLLFINVGVISIFFGLFFKLAAVPGHLWAPDIYDGSPTPIIAFFVLPVKIAVLAIFMKLTIVFKDIDFLWKDVVIYSSITSMILGCVGALEETTIKKFIAWSSTNQMGFLLIGVAASTFDSLQATILYLILYIVMMVCFFQFYINCFYVERNQRIETIQELRNFADKNWRISIGLCLLLFAMAGIPPLAGFFGKYYLFLSAFESEDFILVFTGMMTSLISAYYYLRFVKVLWFEGNRFMYERFQTASKQQINFNVIQEYFFFSLVIYLAFFFLFADFVFEISYVLTTWLC
jgi:NADH-quinone oxidoreductase subunit N